MNCKLFLTSVIRSRWQNNSLGPNCYRFARQMFVCDITKPFMAVGTGCYKKKKGLFRTIAIRCQMVANDETIAQNFQSVPHNQLILTEDTFAIRKRFDTKYWWPGRDTSRQLPKQWPTHYTPIFVLSNQSMEWNSEAHYYVLHRFWDLFRHTVKFRYYNRLNFKPLFN